MFVDYYSILEIQYPSSLDEIKKSYRRLSIKWHPDKNRNIDTSQKMVEINEAYFVLKDVEKKSRYDNEYIRFQCYESTLNKYQESHSNFTCKNNKRNSDSTNSNYSQYDTPNYHFHDTTLEDDMKEANQFARNLVDEFFKEFKESAKRASKGTWEEMWPYFIVIIILPIFFSLIRSCQ